MKEIEHEDFGEFIKVLNKAKEDNKEYTKISNTDELKLGFVVEGTTHWCSILKITDYIGNDQFLVEDFLKAVVDNEQI